MGYVWDINGIWDSYEQELMATLPHSLRSELTYHLYGRVLVSTPCFAWMGDYVVCIKKLSHHVRTQFMCCGDFLFRLGEPCDEISILIDGIVWISQNESLAGVEDDVHRALVRGAESFIIPRNKQAGLVDIGMNALQAATDSVGLRSQFAAKKAVDVLKAFNIKLKLREQEQEMANMHTGIVNKAGMRMKMFDNRLKYSAMRMQKVWRIKQQRKEQQGLPCFKPAASTTVQGMRSTSVQAPAYFGESCLWVPFEMWNTASPHKYEYSAKCIERTEVVLVPRSAIQDVIDQFSPWLADRLELFQKFIHEAVDQSESSAHHRTGTGVREYGLFNEADVTKVSRPSVSDIF
jgi:hypothetical protein